MQLVLEVMWNKVDYDLWNKTGKTTNFRGIHPHGTILTTLEAIRTSQDGIADKVSGNIVA